MGNNPIPDILFQLFFKHGTTDKVQILNDTNEIKEVDGHSVGTFSHSGFSQ